MTNDDFIKPHFVILSINDIQKTRRYLYFRQRPGFGGIINIKKKPSCEENLTLKFI